MDKRPQEDGRGGGGVLRVGWNGWDGYALLPFYLSTQRDSRMQTEQATSGALVYLSSLLSEAPKGYKSPDLPFPLCSFIHYHLRTILMPAHHTLRSAPEPCLLQNTECLTNTMLDP